MWWRMGKQNKQILALFILIQCIITSKDGGSVNAVSLWGKTVDFMQKDCSYWELENKHTIPSLKEVSVCVNIKRKLSNSDWTVFMYLHPNKKRIELGMKGYGSELHIIMFDKVWVSPPVVSLENWHSVCMTWSKSIIKPKVYVNETMVDLKPESNRTVLHPHCCTVAHGGTLTLGVAHWFVMDKLEKETGTELKGSLSLFRIWKRARSAEEISEMTCADGDVLHWEERIWNKVHNCQPVQDVTQQCEWSYYEVNLVLIISREDGHKTNIYDAREVASQWLTKAFAELQCLTGIHLHKVEVFHLRGSSHTGFSGNAKETVAQMATIPGLSQFQCLAHLTAIPRIDVGKMQDELSEVLAKSHKIDHYQIFTDADFIFVYPLDAVLPNPETSPPITTSLPGTTETITSTTPQPMTTTTEMITTLGTTPIQMETSTAFHSSSTVTTTIVTSSTPFMETTLAESSSKTVLSSTTTLTFNTNSTVSTVSPEGIMSDSFFNVNINVTIEGPGEPETIIQTWLYETLTRKGIHVLNFKLMNSTPARRQSVERNSFKVDTKSSLLFSVRHSCVFHAQVITSSITETQKHIHSLLEKSYSNGSVRLDTRPGDILISHIKTGPCPEHNHYTRQGLFKWPQIGAQRITLLSCKGNPEKAAYRQCFLDAESSSALWKSPDLGQCQVVVHSVSDLEDITVTHDNAEDILLMIEDLIRENKDLDEYELSTVLSKLADVINVSMITPPLGEVILNITSDILESDSNLLPFTNSILNITESVGDQMFGFSGGSVSLTSSALAISVVNIDQGNFHNLTFGVSSTNKGFNPEIYINQEPFDGTVAFVSLPSEIQERFPIANGTSPRIQFQFYGVPSLFHTKGDPDGKTLNTFVVSTSVANATRPIENLKEYVAFTLHHRTPKTKYQDVHCVFWDFNKNDGYGGWNPKGCWTYNVSEDYTTCQCDHMTHFGVLVDVSRTPIDEKNERILTLITYMGCGVSSCFLGITVLTYTLLEKLRRDYPSKILLNLSLALLGLNLVFLLNSWISSFGIYGLCIAVAATLHYFLLTSFTWMGLGAVNMYFALVKVFNVYVPSYILKFCLLGWGIPLIVCGLVLAIKRDAYGMNTMSDSQMTLDDSEMFCWVQNNVVFYVSVVSYVAFILLCNGSIFLVVLIQIRNMQVNQPAGTRSGILKDLRAVASLTFLLGLTWSVAFLAWGPVRVFLLYLFSILNSLQGFFIFVFHCLMKENVRKQWRIHLCCGAFKLQEHSEWSQTATMVPKHKPNMLPLMASVRSIKSNSTQSSTVSSESSQRQVTITRPDLGFVYENSLVIPRAKPGLSGVSRDSFPATTSGLEFPSRPWKNGFDPDIYPK